MNTPSLTYAALEFGSLEAALRRNSCTDWCGLDGSGMDEWWLVTVMMRRVLRVMWESLDEDLDHGDHDDRDVERELSNMATFSCFINKHERLCRWATSCQHPDAGGNDGEIKLGLASEFTAQFRTLDNLSLAFFIQKSLHIHNNSKDLA